VGCSCCCSAVAGQLKLEEEKDTNEIEERDIEEKKEDIYSAKANFSAAFAKGPG
jgi:hypothetical protein